MLQRLQRSILSDDRLNDADLNVALCGLLDSHMQEINTLCAFKRDRADLSQVDMAIFAGP